MRLYIDGTLNGETTFSGKIELGPFPSDGTAVFMTHGTGPGYDKKDDMKAQLHLLCNAHLDPYWLWDWEEGAAAAVSTFRAAADCCELDPSFIFCHNEALLYQWVEQFEPVLFERIRQLVQAGRWHIMGGWHVQPDCNLPCGEAFARQILIGKRWFLEKFAVEPRTAINFDPFGHTRGLVQLLKKGGHDSYIICRPSNTDCPLPAEAFTWVGYDGSEITVQRCRSYNSPLGKAAEAVQQAAEQVLTDQLAVGLKLWGVGNHGGGPSRQDVCDLEKLLAAASAGAVEISHSTPEAFFAALRASGTPLPQVERDLNSWAVGCYTSQIRIKQKNRLLENELWATEKMLTNAAMQTLLSYPTEPLRDVMRDLAVAQFHDILPGSSVQSVEDAGIRLFDHGLEILSRLKARAFFALAAGQPAAVEGEIPVLIYNPHPWQMHGVWECEFMLADQNRKDEFTVATVYRNGQELPTQIEKEASNLTLDWRKRVVFTAELAPSSMNRFDCKLARLSARPRPQVTTAENLFHFDNGTVCVDIDLTTGLLTRYAVAGDEYLRPNACRLLVIADNEDPWGMRVNGFRHLAGTFALLSSDAAARLSGLRPGNRPAAVRVIEDGPVRTVVEALFGFNDSYAVQTYKLPKSGADVEIQIRVFWNEKDHLLKWSVPTCFPNSGCLGQVACGVESLATDGRELVAQQWLMAADVTAERAVSVLNDGVYGADCQNGELRVTLLRSPAYSAHPIDDRPLVPQDRFTPRIDQGERLYNFRLQGGGLAERLARVDSEALLFNQKPMTLSFFPAGGGTLALPGATIDDPTVQLQAFKQAEDGHGWIARLFNPTAATRSATLAVAPLGVATLIAFSPFELKTLRISPDGGTVVETDLIERPLRTQPKELLTHSTKGCKAHG